MCCDIPGNKIYIYIYMYEIEKITIIIIKMMIIKTIQKRTKT